MSLGEKTYGGAAYDEAAAVLPTADGGYIVAGNSWSDGPGGAWVFKLDVVGNILWQKTYVGTDITVARAIRSTADGGYVLAGRSGYAAWVLKLVADGNIDWQKSYVGAGLEDARSIATTADGGYVITAQTALGAGNFDFWVLKLNGAGAITWQNTYGGIGSDIAVSIDSTSDGG